MAKMIVTDLDGTLLNKKKQLSQKTIDTLIKAQEMGYRLVLATGRNYQSLKPIYQILKMDQFKTGAIIGLNGAELFCFDQNYYEKNAMLTKKECQELVEYGHKHLCEVMIMEDKRVLDCISPLLLFCKKIVYRIIHKVVLSTFEGQANEHLFIDVHDSRIDQANKAGFSQLPLYIDKKLPRFQRDLDERYEVVLVSKGWIEIMPKGINKGSGLKKVMNYFNLDQEDVICFGDGENDLSMLEIVEHSYAMDNALKKVKKAANYSCPSNENEGVAVVVEKMIKGGSSSVS